MAPKLSVVTGTLDRLPLLMQCIPAIRLSCALGGIPYEIIVVDGGSHDGTAEFLIEQPDITVIWQGQRAGAIAAFNAGFAIAQGEYVCNLNDDAICMGPVLPEACRLLDAHPGAGQIAIPFSDPRHPPSVHYISVGNPERRYLYANFGVTRRAIGEAVGWWGAHGYHYGGDTELSLQVWRMGYSVMALGIRTDCFIRHYRMQDATRLENNGEGRALGHRWQKWDGNPTRGAHA